MAGRSQFAVSLPVDCGGLINRVSALVALAAMKPATVKRFVRAAMWFSVAVVLIYWFLWCCASPVTNGDSRVYNLARLWLIERGGLFGNPLCLWDRHLIFPWTFDAAHYPFLYLHRGYELPSFLCFIGILAATYRIMDDRFGGDAGLVAITGLLGLPMVVYQAVNTKNDLVIVFGLVVWFYAIDRYLRDNRRLHLAMGALALAIVLGSKSSGLIVAGLAIAVTPAVVVKTIWRHHDAGWFLASGVIALFFWSSWEIYLNNKLQFGSFFGDLSEYRTLVNHDGWRGVIANHIRYILSCCDLFIVPKPIRVVFGHWKALLGEGILAKFGLTGSGIAQLKLHPVSENDFFRVSVGVYAEATSTFGLLGMLGMIVVPISLATRRRSDLAWKFAALSLASFIILVALMGWHPSGHRYLLVPFVFGFWAMIACVYSNARRWPVWALRWIALASIWMVPIVAVSKPIRKLPVAITRPLDLLPRSEAMIRHQLDKLAADKQLPLLLYCGPRAHIFYVFDKLRENVIPVVKFDKGFFNQLESRYQKTSFSVLVINAEVPTGLDSTREIDSQSQGTNRDSDTLAIWNDPQ
jgi:hypothetical protein